VETLRGEASCLAETRRALCKKKPRKKYDNLRQTHQILLHILAKKYDKILCV
jgi:hypothetical protein